METTALRFATAVRCLSAAARRQGLRSPTFRSPPRVRGAVRTVRHWPSGASTVAVVTKGRPWAAVLGDLVEGFVVANRLTGPAAERARAALWRAVADDGEVAA